MNMRVNKPVVVAADFSAPRDSARRIAQARVVAIAEDVSALTFDTPAGESRTRAGRLGGEIAGRPFPRPVVSTRLPLRRGGLRHVLLVRQSADHLASSRCRLAIDAEPVAAVDPDWLQSPLAETFELIDGLSEDGRIRLLRMFLTTAGSLYGGGRMSDYGAAVLRIAALLDVPELPAASVCFVGAGGLLRSHRLPAGAATQAIEALVAVSEDRVTRVPGYSAQIERSARGALLHVFAPGAAFERTLVGFGPEPLILGCAAASDPRPLAPWFARRSDETKAWVEGLVDAASETDPTAAALRAELRHVEAPPPALVVRHLSASGRGVLALVDLTDPHQLVASVRIEVDGGAHDLSAPPGARSADGRVTVGGFVELTHPPRSGTTCSLRLVYGSRRVHTARRARLDDYAGAIPAGFAELETSVAAAAIAAARLSRRQRDFTPVSEAIGLQPPRPKLSLVVAAGANPDAIRALAAALAAEPEAAAIEVLYHVGAERATALKSILRSCLSVFGQSCRVLSLPEDADRSERLCAGLNAARGAAALALGADVLPAAPGWLAAWARALNGSRSPAVLGGVLLSHDGAVADAGGRVAVDARRGGVRIDRPWRGLPSGLLPAATSAPTDLVTADCVGLNRASIAGLRDSDARYPEPDVLLAELALRLRRGRARTLLNARFIRFGDGGGRDGLAAAIDAQALAGLLGAGWSQGAA